MDLAELHRLLRRRAYALRLAALFRGRAQAARARNRYGSTTSAGDAFETRGLERAVERFTLEAEQLELRLRDSWRSCGARRSEAPPRGEGEVLGHGTGGDLGSSRILEGPR